MKALILAGGLGTRLKEVIHDRPKVMAPINGRPFLEYIIETLQKNGIEEIIISIGYLGDQIKNYFGDGKNFGVKILYSVEEYPLGTGGAVKKAADFFQETFLVANGDTYLDLDLQALLGFHEKNNAPTTLALSKRSSSEGSGFVKLDRSNMISSFIEKPEKTYTGWVNAGYYLLEPSVLGFLELKPKISLEENFFPTLVKNKQLYGFKLKKDFFDIGTPSNYLKASKVLSQQKNLAVYSQAPTRISFAGGGTDLPSYFLKYGGCVISGAINKFAKVSIKPLKTSCIKVILHNYQKEEAYPLGEILPYTGDIFDLPKAVLNKMVLKKGVEISVKGDFPAGSGLGSSSAVTVALIGAILKQQGKTIVKKEIAELAVEVERETLKVPGGWQDQYISSFGGINLIKFQPNLSVDILPIKLSSDLLNELTANLLLFYLDGKRSEKEQQEFLKKQLIKKSVKSSLEELKDIALKMMVCLKKGDVDQTGRLLHQAWLAKKKTSGIVSNPLIDKIYKEALLMGAKGGKLLGSGGGGCLLLFAPPENQKVITQALKNKGVKLLPFEFDFTGLSFNTYED